MGLWGKKSNSFNWNSEFNSYGVMSSWISQKKTKLMSAIGFVKWGPVFSVEECKRANNQKSLPWTSFSCGQVWLEWYRLAHTLELPSYKLLEGMQRHWWYTYVQGVKIHRAFYHKILSVETISKLLTSEDFFPSHYSQQAPGNKILQVKALIIDWVKTESLMNFMILPKIDCICKTYNLWYTWARDLNLWCNKRLRFILHLTIGAQASWNYERVTNCIW